MLKKLTLISITILTIISIVFYPKVSNTLNLATGFSAKNICSGHFISQFKVEDISDEALSPISPMFDMVNYNVDEDAKSVRTNIFGLFSRIATYRDGLGCTLHHIGQQQLITNINPLPKNEISAKESWPNGNADTSENDTEVNYSLLSAAIDKAFSETDQTGRRNVKAILVIHKGKLIAERYSKGVTSTTPLLSWSMAKSITSLQVALLVKTGKLNLYSQTDVPLWQQTDDPRSSITLDQLMRMSSGLEFNESYGINTDVSIMLSNKANAGLFAADKPLEHDINTHWSYSSGTTNIISGIVKRAIGGSFQDYYKFTQEHLFHPLGISSAISETDASDSFIGSSYFYATGRDWAKLGQLMLQNGRWNDEQILPENWVKYSSTATKTNPTNRYGAQFWLNQDPTDSSKTRYWPSVPSDAYYMGGYQGQYVVMIPSKDTLVLRFGFTNPGIDRGMDELISESIAAIENN